ncbi:MAG: filamentous hemagglutinin N-terminal domain-containing protein, partial [Roseateles sp.]
MNRQRRRSLTATAAAVATVMAGGAVTAAPTGGQVIAGQASIAQQGTQTLIQQQSQRAILNWQTFGVKAGEQVRFDLPSASAAVLNRVLGADPSVIAGQLQSNGRVFLVNPNGVLVGPGGQVLSHGFIASTRDVDNAAFLRGDRTLRLSGSGAAAVVNQGLIVAREGDVVLMAQQVVNEGRIEAPQGTAALAAGGSVLLARDGQDRLLVSLTPAADASVRHGGHIEAAAADLRAVGGNPLALAVQSSGAIRAFSLTTGAGGEIRLSGSGRTEVAGALDAQGSTGQGGRITVEGAEVALQPGARLDASGAAQGGTVHVGGGWQGRDATLANARQTDVATDVQLRADATASGSGGEVVVWADGSTRFAGQISARGAGAGDG